MRYLATGPSGLAVQRRRAGQLAVSPDRQIHQDSTREASKARPLFRLRSSGSCRRTNRREAFGRTARFFDREKAHARKIRDKLRTLMRGEVAVVVGPGEQDAALRFPLRREAAPDDAHGLRGGFGWRSTESMT